jgi:hypothetical protein
MLFNLALTIGCIERDGSQSEKRYDVILSDVICTVPWREFYGETRATLGMVSFH